MKLYHKVIAAIVPIAILLVLGFKVLLDRSFGSMCRNEIFAESLSPDRTKKLVVFQRSCGATTGFSTQVSVLSVDAELPNELGNVFVADTDHGIAPSGARGGPELRSHWAGPNSLMIQHHVAARVFKAEPLLKNVEIKYEILR
jgi:hypothetical protein